MTATTVPTTAVTTAAPTHAVRRAAITSGAVAAASLTAVAAAADAAGVPLAVDGEAIPLAGFAQLTALGAAGSGLIAAACRRWTTRPRRVFTAVAIALTALSCIPSVVLPPDAATQLVLVGTHALAAVIIVPVLARRLGA